VKPLLTSEAASLSSVSVKIKVLARLLTSFQAHQKVTSQFWSNQLHRNCCDQDELSHGSADGISFPVSASSGQKCSK